MDKYIDKLLDSSWFMKIISLVLALLLFSYVYDDNKNLNDVNVPQEQEEGIIEDVPVKSYYDTENLVVTGVPETVDLTITGPRTIVQQAKTQRNFEVFVNLADADIGTRRVPIQIKEISDRLKVTIEPGYANVSIQEKVTKEFSIEAEYNQALIAKGYITDKPVVEPNKIKITGAKDIIEQISYVKATVDLKGPLKDTVTREAKIRALDRDLNKLNVTVEPETVEVTIPVESSSKTVPINIKRIGSPPDGVSIKNITLDQNEATIIGDKELLNKTENVRVEVDVSDIREDTEFTLPVIIGDGIVEVAPQTVKVKIDVNRTEEKTISNLPIKIDGSNEKYDIAFKDPASGTISLTVSGSSEIVSGLNASDFNILIDVSNLTEGEHSLKLNVTGPDNVKWKLGKKTAKISITEAEA